MYMEVIIMIFLNIKIDNFYMFDDFNLDLTYPRMIKNSLIKNEKLPFSNSINVKKTNILMGGNASGKTTLGKILLQIQHILQGKIHYESKNGVYKKKSR